MNSEEITQFAMDLDAAQRYEELHGLVQMAVERRPKVVVEIGTLLGGTLAAWCKCAADDALIISVDLKNGPWCGPRHSPPGHDETLRSFAGPGQALHLVRADSRKASTVKTVRELLAGRAIDLLFIDGDHTLDGVTSDYESYSPLVAPGGLIAFHDILPLSGRPECQVDVLWRDRVRGEHGQCWEFVESYTCPWGGIGVVETKQS